MFRPIPVSLKCDFCTSPILNGIQRVQQRSMTFTKSSVAVWWLPQLLLLILSVPVSSRSLHCPTDQKREHEVEVVFKLLIDAREFWEISDVSEG